MKLSNRIQDMQFSPIRKLVPFAQEAKSKGVSIYHLNIGQPDIKTPETFMDAVRNFDDKVIKYANSQGIEECVKSFQEYFKQWDMNFGDDEIIITNGGSEALMFALMAICDHGDEVIIPEPFYTNYNGFSAVAGAVVVPFTTKAEDGFHLPSKEEIASKVTDKTRAIMLSNPGNPTGVIYTEAEIRMIAEIALENDLFIISDEVYREFVYDGLKFISPYYIEEVRERVIIIDSVSKRYSACGARIGLLASNNTELMKQIMKLAQSRLCVSTLDQVGSANLINTPKEYLEEAYTEYNNRREILYKKLKEIPNVVCEKPTGAFYVVAKLPIDSGENFAKWLLTDFNVDNKTVMVAPAQGFYATPGLGQDEIRMSYCLNCDALADAMEILKAGVAEYRKTVMGINE